MSFDKLIQDLVARAASRGGTFVYAPVTVNIHLYGQPSTSRPLGRVVNLAKGSKRPLVKGDAWKAAEAQAAALQDEKEHEAALAEAGNDQQPEPPEADSAKMKGKANFRGTVGERTLVDKAVELGLNEVAGHNLWELLATSKELRAFCADHGIVFPPLSKNGMFRRADLRDLAQMEGLPRVKGFGTRSHGMRILKSL